MKEYVARLRHVSLPEGRERLARALRLVLHHAPTRAAPNPSAERPPPALEMTPMPEEAVA